MALHHRRDARVVELGGLENRCPGNWTVGSNPSLSATDNAGRAATWQPGFVFYECDEHACMQGANHKKYNSMRSQRIPTLSVQGLIPGITEGNPSLSADHITPVSYSADRSFILRHCEPDLPV